MQRQCTSESALPNIYRGKADRQSSQNGSWVVTFGARGWLESGVCVASQLIRKKRFASYRNGAAFSLQLS